MPASQLVAGRRLRLPWANVLRLCKMLSLRTRMKSKEEQAVLSLQIPVSS